MSQKHSSSTEREGRVSGNVCEAHATWYCRKCKAHERDLERGVITG